VKEIAALLCKSGKAAISITQESKQPSPS